MRKKLLLFVAAAFFLLLAKPNAQVTLPYLQTFDDYVDGYPLLYFTGDFTLYGGSYYNVIAINNPCTGSLAMGFTGNAYNVVSINLPTSALQDSVSITFNTSRSSDSAGTFQVGYLTSTSSSSFVPLVTYSAVDTEFATNCNLTKYINLSNVPDSAVAIAFCHQVNANNLSEFWYIDNLQIFREGNCPTPNSIYIDNVTETTAELYFVSSGMADGYIIYLNGILFDTAHANPYTFDSLQPATSYSLTVQTLCDSVIIGQSYLTSFNTECPVSHLPFFDDMNSHSSFPICYSAPLHTMNIPLITDFEPFGQIMYVINTQELVVLPKLLADLDGNDINVSFKYAASFVNDSVRVGYMTDPTDTSTFTAVATFVYDSISMLDGELHEYNAYIPISDQTDTMNIAFWFYSASMIDEINVRSISPSCHMPTAAWIDSLTDGSATLRWQNPDGIIYQYYEVMYSTSYSTTNDTVMLYTGTTDTSFTITGLNAKTEYYFWIRPLCADTSNWFYVGHAETPCPSGYDAPFYVDFRSGYANFQKPICWNELLFDSFSTRPCVYNRVNNGVTLGGLEFFNQAGNTTNLITLPYIRLQANNMMITMLADADPLSGGIEVGYMTELSDTAIFYPLDTVTSQEPYLYDIQTSTVPPTIDTIWIAFRFSTVHGARLYYINVDTIPACVRPAEIIFDTVGHNFVNVTLLGATASSYEVRYSTIDNIDSATSIVVNSSVFTIDSLQTLTTYYTWVRSICGALYSEWRTGPSFTTMCGADACPITIELTDPNSIISMAMFTGCGVNIYSDTTFLCKIEDYQTERNFYSETIWVCPDMAPLNFNADAGSFAAYGGWLFQLGTNIILADSTVLYYNLTLYPHGTTFLTLNNPCPLCPPVQEVYVTDVTYNSVTITWTPADSTDDSWVIYLDTVAVDTVTDSTHTYTFTGLDDNTMYSFGVATDCSGTPASIIYFDTFTACQLYEPCPFRVELTDIEGSGCYMNNHLQVWSNNYIVADLSSTSMFVPLVITEDVFVCSGDSVHVVWSGYGSPAFDHSFIVNVWDGSGAWMAGDTASAYSYDPNIVTFMPECPCLAPDTVTTVPDINSITVTWNNADSTELQISTSENFDVDTFTVFTNHNTYTFDGLTHNTVYYIRLRAFCSIGGRISEWGEFVDTTLYDSNYVDPNTHRPCPAPEGLTLISTSYTTATVGWHPTGDEPEWEVAVTVQGEVRLDTVADTVYTITGLWPEVPNYVSVRALCGENHVDGDWSDTITFFTDVCQPVPAASIGIGDLTSSSASVSWQTMENSLGYELYYGEPGFYVNEATIVNLPQETPFYTMDSLEAESDYEFFIVNRCTETLTSAATDRVQFSTLAETGIATVNPDALTLAPNPASEMVTLRVNGISAPITVEVVDMTGKVLTTLNAEHSTLQLDVSQFAQGAYFIRVTGENIYAVRKLVVK